MDFINSLREKHPTVKKRIAIVSSAVVTLAIFGVWALALHFGLGQKSPDATAAVANSNDVNPLSAFVSVISKGWEGLTNNINQIKTGTDNAKQFVESVSTALATSTNTASSTPEPNSEKEVLIFKD